jgi:hypothetical protein
MSDSGSAIVGASAVLVVAYGTNFLAERYRRFLDANALASGLAGELEAHMKAYPKIKKRFPELIGYARDGDVRYIPDIGAPNSPVFEGNVGKLGLLGNKLPRDVAYAYEIVRAFRGLLGSVIKEQRTITNFEFANRLQVALDLLLENEPAARDLVIELDRFAARHFEWFPWVWLG